MLYKLRSRLYEVLHAFITARRMNIIGPIYSGYMSLSRNRVECKIHFFVQQVLLESSESNLNKSKLYIFFCQGVKEVLSQTRNAELVGERSPDCASRPRQKIHLFYQNVLGHI